MNRNKLLAEHGYRWVKATNPQEYDDPDDAPDVLLSPDGRYVTVERALDEIETDYVAKREEARRHRVAAEEKAIEEYDADERAWRAEHIGDDYVHVLDSLSTIVSFHLGNKYHFDDDGWMTEFSRNHPTRDDMRHVWKSRHFEGHKVYSYDDGTFYMIPRALLPTIAERYWKEYLVVVHGGDAAYAALDALKAIDGLLKWNGQTHFLALHYGREYFVNLIRDNEIHIPSRYKGTINLQHAQKLAAEYGATVIADIEDRIGG